MTSMTYPSGPVMNYQYDAFGRMQGMTENNNGSNTLAAAAVIGSNSQLLLMQYGANTTPFFENRSFNTLLQLTHLTVSSPTAGVDTLASVPEAVPLQHGA